MGFQYKQLAFFAKQNVFRRRAIRTYRALLENEKLGVEALRELNWAKRRRLLIHAYQTAPFYRRRLQAAGIHPSEVLGEADWERLPVLTRSDLVSSPNDILSSDAARRRLVVATTGGSTGVPVKVYYDPDYPRETLAWRMLSWWGLSPADDGAYCWRMLRTSPSARLLNAAMWWPTRHLRFDASSMSSEGIRAFLSLYNTVRPPLLQGYTGAIAHLAEFVEQTGLAVVAPKAIWVTSSPLALGQRGLIERAFSGPVYDQYGSAEMPYIAAQCRQKHHLHVFSDAVHLECVDEAGAACPIGEEGRVLVTDLENYAFPLIRYENGDRAALQPVGCGCGSPLPRMSAVLGRVTDNLLLPDGSVITGAFVTTLFDDYTEVIASFQVVQRKDQSIIIRVVPHSNVVLAAAASEHAVELLRRSSRGQVVVGYEFVSAICSDRGKTRFVIRE
ncbi:MAG: hypothetical protein RBU37_26720 [Myxococcota bacterium]|jgi:phenylacetate-CoA ligase|nr:hypothetical protein [Myxococcota bacterium]